MFFVASKVLGFLAAPSNVLLLMGLAGAVCSAGGLRGLGAGLMATALIGLGVAGLSPLGNLLLSPLEERFPRSEDGVAPTGVIVLGGSFDTVVAGARRDVALTEASERLTVVAELARRWPDARIVFTGGSGSLLWSGTSEAELAKRVFVSFGIAEERLTLEGEARNTVENARLTKPLAAPKPGERWLLVTSAYHMPRAIGCFRTAGFAVEAWPVDYRTRGPADALRPFPSLSAGLRRVDIAAREWIGLVTYWWLGYVDAPLPRP